MIDFTWKIGGAAGFGIKTIGDMFSRSMIRAGYHIFDYVEYPSLIRGGHNVNETRVGDKEVFAQKKTVEMLVALNRETFDLHKHELTPGAVVIYDKDQFEIKQKEVSVAEVTMLHVPLQQLVQQVGAEKVMSNNVALGASLAVLQVDFAILERIIKDQFSDKGEAVIQTNHAAAEAGYRFVQKNYTNLKFKIHLDASVLSKQENIFVTGNEAVALGAIAAGCKFYIAYPMEPSTSILHTMAAFAEQVGMVVRHAEDEIAVINSACGAGFAGVRTMLGTAGGGFSLMVEGLGLVGLTETPLVIFEAQRPGPATGMPTWTSQGDLRFVLHAHQDDFPRIILAPGDVAEAFELAWKAFNYAEIYQTPVIIMSDKYLAESHKSTLPFVYKQVKIDRGKLVLREEDWNEAEYGQYLRYKVTADGIPFRAVPGLKNTLFTANSYEHTEYGLSSERIEDRVAQVDRRWRKLATFRQNDLPEPRIFGPHSANLTLIGWGSTKGPALQAISDLEQKDPAMKVNYIHLNYIWPFPAQALQRQLAEAKQVLLLEGNQSALLKGLIRQETGVNIESVYLKYDGRPFYAEDIIERIGQGDGYAKS